MTNIESKAADVVNALLANENLPMNRVKSIDLNWDDVSGEFLPVLNCEFYEEANVFKDVFK